MQTHEQSKAHLAKLALAAAADSAVGMKWLYVDALNYGQKFFPVRDPWDVNRAFSAVCSLAAAARKSGFQLKAFIDASTVTDEAKVKWRTRREREVQSMQVNLGYLLRLMACCMYLPACSRIRFRSIRSEFSFVGVACAHGCGVWCSATCRKELVTFSVICSERLEPKCFTLLTGITMTHWHSLRMRMVPTY